MEIEQKKYIFHVNGMHCNSCVLMIESELGELPHVTRVKSSLKNCSVEVVGNFSDRSMENIATELSEVIKDKGYTLSVDGLEKFDRFTAEKNKKYADFKLAVPIALGFAVLFVILQKLGLVNLVNSSEVTYGTAFVIGIIASLSTCMAVVGGLLLSMSATFAKGGERTKPQILFHLGRIVAFFFLGGVIGALGSAFTLNASGTFALNLLIGIVMIILGINLLDIFPWAKKLQPAMPKFLSKHALGVAKFNHTLTPLLVGVATFFLPCGFTQSMQLYSLTTGSFLGGALTMTAFAVGTFPVLALISFSSFSIQKNKKRGVFFKTAGIVVIMFAIFNIINSLAVLGIIPPIFNF